MKRVILVRDDSLESEASKAANDFKKAINEANKSFRKAWELAHSKQHRKALNLKNSDIAEIDKAMQALGDCKLLFGGIADALNQLHKQIIKEAKQGKHPYKESY